LLLIIVNLDSLYIINLYSKLAKNNNINIISIIKLLYIN